MFVRCTMGACLNVCAMYHLSLSECVMYYESLSVCVMYHVSLSECFCNVVLESV